jgi:hypothetical protein
LGSGGGYPTGRKLSSLCVFVFASLVHHFRSFDILQGNTANEEPSSESGK